jgi:hypothetical protein
MVSSNRFGGGAARARPRVQVRPASGTESGTIVTAQQEMGRDRECELFPDYRGHVDTRGTRRQRVEIGVVRSLGIAREDGRIDVDVRLFQHFGEAPPTLAPNHRVNTASPEILALGGGLQLSVDRHGPGQVQVEALEHGIVGTELSIGTNGTPQQVPDIYSQHSLLN